ncbi:MAG TPA: hypothetical protein VFN80_00415 [Acidothermaceae bacterium]|nr:hypothetical protein [Acidothermaceae bacterium]
MHRTHARFLAWSLVVGCVVASAGYASAFLANGNSDNRFAGSSWVALYTVASFGNVLVLLGLPTLLRVHGDRSRVLTLLGYIGIVVPLAVLNVGEGTVEGFVKPYLAKHGGIPKDDLPGLLAFEAPALVIVLVGMICLGVAVLRARVLPRWVGVAFFVVPVLGVAGIPGAAGLVSDYLLFVALFAVGVHALRSPREVEGRASEERVAVPA